MLELLDPLSIIFTMTLTVLTVAVLYLVDTFARQDRSAGRLWAFGYLALLISTLGYLASYTMDRDSWAITALGDACFVLFFGALWSGARRFNGRHIGVSSLLGVGLAILVFLAECAEATLGFELLGLLPRFLVTALLAGLAATESVRGRMARKETMLLSIALTFVALFNLASFLVHTIPGLLSLPGAESVFTPVVAALITIPVAVTAVATTMVLRAGDRLGLAEERSTFELRVDDTGMLTASSMTQIAKQVALRASSNGEQIAVLAMVITDLEEIGSALGADVQHGLEAAWRESWVRHSPTAGIPGEVGRDCLALILHPSTFGEASRVINRLYGKVVEDLAKLDGAVLPVTGFGFAMSGEIPDEALVAAARDAASNSATGDARGQLVSLGEDMLERTLPPREES